MNSDNFLKRQIEIRNKHWETWKHVFSPFVHRHLVAYFHPVFGFNIVQFDKDWFRRLGYSEDERLDASLLDSVNERIGPYAVAMIYDLLDTPEDERPPIGQRFEMLLDNCGNDSGERQGLLFDITS